MAHDEELSTNHRGGRCAVGVRVHRHQPVAWARSQHVADRSRIHDCNCTWSHVRDGCVAFLEQAQGGADAPSSLIADGLRPNELVRCKTCHYSLAGLIGPPHRCPECGKEFDPTVPHSFLTAAQLRSVRMHRYAIAAGVGLLVVMIALIASLRHSPMLLLFMIPPSVVVAVGFWNARSS